MVYVCMSVRVNVRLWEISKHAARSPDTYRRDPGCPGRRRRTDGSAWWKCRWGPSRPLGPASAPAPERGQTRAPPPGTDCSLESHVRTVRYTGDPPELRHLTPFKDYILHHISFRRRVRPKSHTKKCTSMSWNKNRMRCKVARPGLSLPYWDIYNFRNYSTERNTNSKVQD